MPLDTCINNVGEYFSSHYLDSTFAKDVKELVSKWNEQGSQSVPKRVAALSQHYFKAKTQALDEELPENRHTCGDEITGRVILMAKWKFLPIEYPRGRLLTLQSQRFTDMRIAR